MGELVLTTYDWVPEMPRGFVRDLRIRWALEPSPGRYCSGWARRRTRPR